MKSTTTSFNPAMTRFFYSLITLIIALLFILIGIIALIIPWTESIRTTFVDFLLHNTVTLSLFGIALIFIGAALLVNILLNSRRSYYHLKAGPNAIDIDEKLIDQLLSAYLRQLFPNCDIPHHSFVKHNRIAISADLPHMPLKEQKLFLEKVKSDLANLLTSQLDYHHEFSLSATFAPAKIQ